MILSILFAGNLERREQLLVESTKVSEKSMESLANKYLVIYSARYHTAWTLCAVLEPMVDRFHRPVQRTQNQDEWIENQR